jgi:hypothetical protein
MRNKFLLLLNYPVEDILLQQLKQTKKCGYSIYFKYLKSDFENEGTLVRKWRHMVGVQVGVISEEKFHSIYQDKIWTIWPSAPTSKNLS